MRSTQSQSCTYTGGLDERERVPPELAMAVGEQVREVVVDSTENPYSAADELAAGRRSTTCIVVRSIDTIHVAIGSVNDR